MNYGIEQLQQYAKHFESIKYYVNDYKNNILKKPKGVVLEFLNDFKKNIEEGLKTWGDSYQEEKKRQEKRLKDVKKLLDF